MNTDTHIKPHTNKTQDAVGDAERWATDGANELLDTAKDTYVSLASKVDSGVERTREYAQHAVDATKDAAHRASETAKDLYQSASAKAEEAMVSSKDYARENPVSVALTTLVTGLAIGYLVGSLNRVEPTFRQRLFSAF
jgi:ElaB/YqjD/DUF883 family membrane-anchored ribosome-binding protein